MWTRRWRESRNLVLGGTRSRNLGTVGIVRCGMEWSRNRNWWIRSGRGKKSTATTTSAPRVMEIRLTWILNLSLFFSFL